MAYPTIFFYDLNYLFGKEDMVENIHVQFDNSIKA